jgi:hypothetical protein
MNTFWLCFLDSSKARPGLWKQCSFSRSQQSCSGFTGLDWWTSSKISSVGSHTEHWCRCSKTQCLFQPKFYFLYYIINSSWPHLLPIFNLLILLLVGSKCESLDGCVFFLQGLWKCLFLILSETLPSST